MNVLKDKIKHIIVLMLENRSFDNIAGKLYETGRSFNGLNGNETNPYNTPDGVRSIQIWNNGKMDPSTMTIPDPDPGELFSDINCQLFGLGMSPGTGPPPMTGFVNN